MSKIREEELENKASLSVSEKIELAKIKRDKEEEKGQKEAEKKEVPQAKGIFVGEREEIEYIKISKISLPEYKDRTGISESNLKELARSIEKIGLMQPIVVQETKDGYRKIIGRRRIEAHKILGKTKIKAIVINENLSSMDFLFRVLHENTQRERLSMYDKVRGVLELIRIHFNISEKEAITEIGRADNFKKGNIRGSGEGYVKKVKELDKIISDSRIMTSVSNVKKYLPLLKMPKVIVDALNDNKISYEVALLLFRLSEATNTKTLNEMLKKIIDEKLGTKEADRIIRNTIPNRNKKENKSELLKSFNKTISQIPEDRKKDFELELKSLLERYVQQGLPGTPTN